MKGTYHITMVLPFHTVQNHLILEPREGGILDGHLDTLDGHPTVPFTYGRWNKEFFQVNFAVGPGQLQLTGKIQGDTLTGVVVIDDTPDSLTGTRETLNNSTPALANSFTP